MSENTTSRRPLSSNPGRITIPDVRSIYDTDGDELLEEGFISTSSFEREKKTSLKLEENLRSMVDAFLKEGGNLADLKRNLLDRINIASVFDGANPILLVELEVLTKALCAVDPGAMKLYMDWVGKLVKLYSFNE